MPSDPHAPPGRIRFGDFEVDVQSHELLRRGRRIRLQEKSFLVLRELLRNPGQVVTREDLALALWPKEYFVDAEHGLNAAVRRLREALGDSADEPRFVETLPKVGYRFICAIEGLGWVAPPAEVQSAIPGPDQANSIRPASTAAAPETPVRSRGTFLLVAMAILVVTALAASALLTVRARSLRPERSATNSNPGAPTAVSDLLARARYLRNHKRLDESRQFVEKALKLEPTNPEALAGLALAYFGAKEYELARETARRAVELDPNAWEALRALGSVANHEGDLAGAERWFRLSVDANPADYKSRNRLARHLLSVGRLDEAKEQILETRRLAPDDPDVQNIWIQYALLTGDYEGAIRQAEMWLTIWEKQLPELSQIVHSMLGEAYLGARRHDDAIAQFRLVGPDSDYCIAMALAHAGRIDEARTQLAAHEASGAAAGSADDPELEACLASAYVVVGDLDRAFEHLDRQLAAHSYPSWVHYPLLQAIRLDARWPGTAERLEREFFGGTKEAPPKSASPSG